MIGIYRIHNKITGESYIGQSRDIDVRFKEHLHHKKLPVGNDIVKYGIENFDFEVLEECSEDDLDRLEIYYISKYDSFNNGYNRTPGGTSCSGEANANHKLTESDVYNIREAYNNRERKREVYERYKDKVTESYFSNVWEGVSWPNIHMDVYTADNLNYYRYHAYRGDNSDKSVFTEQEVLEFRERYVNESAREIYESLNLQDKCKYETFQAILWGRHYANVPVYNKRTKMWIIGM